MQYADQLTVPANHAGTPGLSLPAGLDSDGLPIGIQLLGPDFSEASLLQLAGPMSAPLENATWRLVRPGRVGKFREILMTDYEVVIGLETHIQLNTITKFFVPAKPIPGTSRPIPISVRCVLRAAGGAAGVK